MRLIAIACHTVLAGLVAACRGDSAPALARPSIDTLPGGIIAVHNTGPAGWADTSGWRFIESARLTSDDADENGIINPRSVALDELGRLFVVEDAPAVIKVFEPDGRLVRTIGREGGGPGEYRSPIPGIHEGHLVVHDPNLARLSIFDTAGTFLTSVPSPCCHFRQLPVTRNGTVAIAGAGAREEFGGAFVRFTATGTLIDTVYVPKDREQRYWEVTRETSQLRMSIPYTPGQQVAFAPNGDMVHGWTSEYRIAIGSGATDTTRVFSLDWTPVERPEGMRRALFDPMVERNVKNWGEGVRRIFRFEDIPATATPFEGLMVDPTGAIWARVFTGDTLRTHYDVFDSTGVYQGRVVAPWRARGGLAWGAGDRLAWHGENEDGYPEIRIYRLDRTVRRAE